MPKPRPAHYRTRAEYQWALQQWRKRTGGYLVTTVVLCMITGGALDGTVGMVGLTLAGVCFHIMLRKADGDSKAVWAQLKSSPVRCPYCERRIQVPVAPDVRCVYCKGHMAVSKAYWWGGVRIAKLVEAPSQAPQASVSDRR